MSIKQLMQPLESRASKTRISSISVKNNAEDERMDDERIFEYGPRACRAWRRRGQGQLFCFLKWFRLVLSEAFERVLHIQDGLGSIYTFLHVTPQPGKHDSTKAEDRSHLYDDFVSPPQRAILQIANCTERAGCVVQFVCVLGADARNEGQMEGIDDMWRVIISQTC